MSQSIPKVMIDLETFGLKPGSVVLSLGAVVFNELDGVLTDHGEVYVRFETVTQYAAGLTTDPETAEWWMDQSEEARRALLDMPVQHTRAALAAFSEWLESVVDLDDEGELNPVEIWGNGANFDAPILRELYEAMALRCPWAWWNERCHRTERKTLQRICRWFNVEATDPDREGVHHGALDDAKYQVKVLTHYNKLIWDKIHPSEHGRTQTS